MLALTTNKMQRLKLAEKQVEGCSYSADCVWCSSSFMLIETGGVRSQGSFLTPARAYYHCLSLWHSLPLPHCLCTASSISIWAPDIWVLTNIWLIIRLFENNLSFYAKYSHRLLGLARFRGCRSVKDPSHSLSHLSRPYLLSHSLFFFSLSPPSIPHLFHCVPRPQLYIQTLSLTSVVLP